MSRAIKELKPDSTKLNAMAKEIFGDNYSSTWKGNTTKINYRSKRRSDNGGFKK
jgi:hypothetical protein